MRVLTSFKELVIALGIVCFYLSLSFIQVYAQTDAPPVAVVNGKSFTQQQLDETISSQLLPLQKQIYAVRKAALDNLVTRAVLEDEARQRGISVEALKKELSSGEVKIDQAQVEQLYLENSSAFASMSPDEAKERLRLDLETQARMKRYRDAVAELKKAAKIDLRLEEPRLPVVVSNLEPMIGSKEAAVTIIEFSDFQCPFCRESQPVLKKILQNYGDRIRLIFKHLPLDIHDQAFASAQAAVCAGKQGRFWPYHDSLFTSTDLSQGTLTKLASSSGLDLPNFKACMSSEASRAAVVKDVSEAKLLGINSTPTFIVNGRLVEGALGFDDFKALIEQELKAAQKSVRAPLKPSAP